MTEIVFLGTGGAFARGARTNVSLLIEWGDFRTLVECTPCVIHQLSRVGIKPTEIEHLFVSHRHGDHTLGFPMLLLTRLDVPTPLHVYAGATTIRTLGSLWELVYPGFDLERLGLHWHEMPEEGQGEVHPAPGVTLRTAVVPHMPGVPTLAARWDLDGGPSITFVTDTIPSEVSVELARGSDLLIHEASFSAALQSEHNAKETFHTTARQAGDIARRARCPRLALVHLGSIAGSHPDVLIGEARSDSGLEVIIPRDGDRLAL